MGELAARFLEQCGVRAAFGVISIHNMPILDAFHTRQKIRFVSARGEAGACNMADAYARVSGTMGVCVTSTGTGCGNAAGAMVEAITAGTPLLHLTGQIESDFLDRDLGYIHEHPAQLAMLKSVGKDAFRIRNPETALATLREAVRLAQTPPCGPVSIEIPIDVQKMLLDLPADLSPLAVPPVQPNLAAVDALAERLLSAKRPLLWLGGGARGASPPRTSALVKMGWACGILGARDAASCPKTTPPPWVPTTCRSPPKSSTKPWTRMLAVGTRLRSNETLNYKLKLPATRYRIDANALAHNRGYSSELFVHGDAEINAQRAGRPARRPHADRPGKLAADVKRTRAEAASLVDGTLGQYAKLKNAWPNVKSARSSGGCVTSRSPTACGATARRCSTTRAPACTPWAAALARAWRWAWVRPWPMPNTHSAASTISLCGDGGFMLNLSASSPAPHKRKPTWCSSS